MWKVPKKNDDDSQSTVRGDLLVWNNVRVGFIGKKNIHLNSRTQGFPLLLKYSINTSYMICGIENVVTFILALHISGFSLSHVNNKISVIN